MAQICKIWTIGGSSTRSLRRLPRRKAPSSSFHTAAATAKRPTTAVSAAITLDSHQHSGQQHRPLSFSRNYSCISTSTSTSSAAAPSRSSVQSASACMSSTPLSFIKTQLTRTTALPRIARLHKSNFVGVSHRNFFTSRIAMSGSRLLSPAIDDSGKEDQSRQSRRRARWRRTDQSYLGNDQETTHSALLGH